MCLKDICGKDIPLQSCIPPYRYILPKALDKVDDSLMGSSTINNAATILVVSTIKAFIETMQ